MILFCQSILETRKISHLCSSALFIVPLILFRSTQFWKLFGPDEWVHLPRHRYTGHTHIHTQTHALAEYTFPKIVKGADTEVFQHLIFQK